MMQRLQALMELGKFKIVELWLGFFVGVSLLETPILHDTRVLTTLLLILAVGIAVIAATCSLDDVVGFQDGVDAANHLGRERWGVNKPLLSGRLKIKQATAFIAVLAGLIVLGLVGTVALAWPLPLWLIATLLALITIAINYSSGLKLSYHGAGEGVIFLGGLGTVLIPYALVMRHVSPTLLFEAVLVGSWHAQVVMFSNTVDVVGDRATGRRTIATRCTPTGNKIYIAAVFVLFWGITGTALGIAKIIPAYVGLLLLPIWILQVQQLRLGIVREQWLAARLLGFRVLRLGIVLLTAANFWMH